MIGKHSTIWLFVTNEEMGLKRTIKKHLSGFQSLRNKGWRVLSLDLPSVIEMEKVLNETMKKQPNGSKKLRNKDTG